MLKVLELEGHRTVEQDHGGGLVTVSCTCGGFKLQGDIEDTADLVDALEAHMANAGARAGLELAAS